MSSQPQTPCHTDSSISPIDSTAIPENGKFATASDRFVQLNMKIGQERLRQAQYSFNIALVSSAACIAVSFVGAAMLLGKAPEGAAVASSGMLSSAGCVRLAKDANDRLDKLANDLLDES
ncbi:MAG: hypothetical protein MUC48_08645 [Leptolyngbya sp. Prado105]|jgi:hypothetical protein|nr:hypothetical protein [Leptolyngbya sp. Prado105]